MQPIVRSRVNSTAAKSLYRGAGLLIATAIATMSAAAQGDTPERTVTGTIIHSSADPAVDISLPTNVSYAGTDSFTISKPSTANACQLFAFAKGTADGRLTKIYWVHFETILPSFPKARMTYESARRLKIGGMAFVFDTEVSDGTGTPVAGSDTEHFYNLLAARGYRRVPMIFVRFVHLLDRTKRKELMIIVGEALPTNITADALKPGGAAYAQRPAIERDFVSRAARSIAIRAVGRGGH